MNKHFAISFALGSAAICATSLVHAATSYTSCARNFLPKLPYPLRMTDLQDIPGVSGGRRMTFEVMNWGDSPARGIVFVLGNTGTPGPRLTGARIDRDGRPWETPHLGNDDCTYPPNDGRLGSKVPAPSSGWTAVHVGPSWIFSADVGATPASIPPRNLLGPTPTPTSKGLFACNAAAACSLIPGCNPVTREVAVCDDIDNGGAQQPGPGGVDNTLDGFVLEFEDWNNGTNVSLAWYLLNENRQPMLYDHWNTLTYGAITFKIPFNGVGLTPIYTGYLGSDQDGCPVSEACISRPPTSFVSAFTALPGLDVESGAGVVVDFPEIVVPNFFTLSPDIVLDAADQAGVPVAVRATIAGCGDGNLDFGEQCDDGNVVGGDGCSSRCSFEPTCGNGFLDVSEECEDGNTLNGDGCSFECSIEPVCGNGRLEPGEQCDDVNLVNGDGCSSVCGIEPVCGNGRIEAGEQCDDGNLVNGDGCSSACIVTSVCGNGNLEWGEQCDDGNHVNNDNCSNVCRLFIKAPFLTRPGFASAVIGVLGIGAILVGQRRRGQRSAKR